MLRVLGGTSPGRRGEGSPPLLPVAAGIEPLLLSAEGQRVWEKQSREQQPGRWSTAGASLEGQTPTSKRCPAPSLRPHLSPWPRLPRALGRLDQNLRLCFVLFNVVPTTSRGGGVSL